MYFIAILPPAPILQEVLTFKQFIAEKWGPKHALRSPAHLTLVPPFDWEKEQLPALEDVLTGFAGRQTSFSVELKNFGAFPPRVIFVKPVPNARLERLYRELVSELDQRLGFRDPRHAGKQKPFHPHMTIAHRDVAETDFRDIWSEFRNRTYDRQFDVLRLSLMELVQHKWVERSSFWLKGT